MEICVQGVSLRDVIASGDERYDDDDDGCSLFAPGYL